MEELLAIFCDVDDFCNDYEEYCQHHLLMDRDSIIPKTSMSLSEIMTIVIYFHLSNQRTFKWYYIKFVGTVAEKSLQELDMQDTEIYADCLYSLGLYHVCLNDTSADNELIGAFRTFIDIYGRDSDFVQARAAEVSSYIETANNGIIQNDRLKQLLGE